MPFPPPGDLQGLNPHLLHWQVTFFHCATWEAQRQDIHFSFAKEFSFSKCVSSTALIYHAFLTFSSHLPTIHLPRSASPLFLSCHNFLCCGCTCSIAQSCPTLCDHMDCSLPGSSAHELSWQEYWSGLPFPTPGIFPSKGSNPHLLCLLHSQEDSLPLCHGKPSGPQVQMLLWFFTSFL